eukprot:gene8874-biopygen8218
MRLVSSSPNQESVCSEFQGSQAKPAPRPRHACHCEPCDSQGGLAAAGTPAPRPRHSPETPGTQSARSRSARREFRGGPPGAQVVSRSVVASPTVAVGNISGVASSIAVPCVTGGN